jgi:hypothetical protein
MKEQTSLSSPTEVWSVEELRRAVASPGSGPIVVRGKIVNAPSVSLHPGQELVGEGESPTIEFEPGIDGVQLTSNNTVRNLSLLTTPGYRAIYNESGVDDLGKMVIDSVHTIGQVQILAEGITQTGHVSVNDLDIQYADVTQQLPRPQGFGVSVLQGAFTLWNRQAAASLTAELRGISIGRKLLPASGGGVFIAGFAQDSIESLSVSQLTTGAIFTRGQIIPGPPGSTVYISCGVGIFWGAHVIDVRNHGSVTTYGDFDMVLDNWGTVDSWVAEKPLTSYGRETAIGFVNYGKIGEVIVRAPIETFGTGSRGFNEYHGSMQKAEFDRITTHGDAAPGVQIGCPVTRLVVHGGIETHGGSGQALVSGKYVQLPAYGLSITDGGNIEEILVDGGIVTHGNFIPAGSSADSSAVPVAAVDLCGQVGALRVNGGILAKGS